MLSVQEIVHLYVDKFYSSSRIATLDGRSKVTICSILKSNGVVIRSPKEARALVEYSKWTSAKREVLRRMWCDEGKKAPEIALALGVTAEAIYDQRHKMGLPMRNRRSNATNDMNGQYYGPVNHGPAVIPEHGPGWPTKAQLMAGR